MTEVYLLEERRLVDGVWTEWRPLHRCCWSAPNDGYFRSIVRCSNTVERRVRRYVAVGEAVATTPETPE